MATGDICTANSANALRDGAEHGALAIATRRQRHPPPPVAALDVGLRALGSRLQAVVWTTDLDLRVSSWLGPALGARTVRPDQVVGQPLDVVFGPDQVGQDLIGAHTQALHGVCTPVVVERSGCVYEVQVVPLRDTAGAITGLAGLAHDITERMRLERELRRAREVRARELAAHTAQLRALYEQAQQNAVLEERQRLARDLHDAVTQMLFSASLIAAVLPRIWEQDQGKARGHLEDLRVLTRGALAEIRTLLLELRPTALTDARLDQLLQQITDAWTARRGLSVTLVLTDSREQRLIPPEVRITFYRVAQEALNNVAKHAHAREVTVQLDQRPEQVALAIRDDGQGFDSQQVTADHLGLTIMQERVAAIRGNLRVESRPGDGTLIQMDWTG